MIMHTHRVRTARRGVARALCAAACAWLSLASTTTRADDIDTQRFQPRATSGGYFMTEGTDLRYPVDPFSLGVWLSYGHNPLIVSDGSGVDRRIVGHQVGLDLTASHAFGSWFELGLHVPMAYLNGDDLSQASLGDVRLLPKFRLLNDATKGVGLAILADVRLPTHVGGQFYGGARMPAFAPRVLLDHRFGLSGFRIGLDVGVLIRKEQDYQNVTAGTELMAGLGMGYRFNGGKAPVELMLDIRNAVGLMETDREEVALEGLLGAGIDLSRDWKLNVGGGVGLLEGFGVPNGRAFAGLRWEPSPNDPDHDGVKSREQAADAAETEAASDEPPASSDEDEPASVDDVDDAAREAAIRGGYDACPDLPEDMDGVEDEDGCPEGDADKDGVLDYQDRCPDEAEMINGYKDDDGCSDEGPAKIVIEDGKITILETIRFELNSSKIDPSSYSIMDQIALTFRAHDEIQRIEIGGHTDSTGPRGLNVRLSRERARSVRQYLLGRGIPPARLGATGYGPDHPIADNETEEGRAANRRVEFKAR
jgi:outer membrane protein OmpA-like peptidoglycan-associated protein